MGVLYVCMSVGHMPAWYPEKPEEAIRSSGTRASDGCEPPLGARNEAFGRGARALNHWAISTTFFFFFKTCCTVWPCLAFKLLVILLFLPLKGWDYKYALLSIYFKNPLPLPLRQAVTGWVRATGNLELTILMPLAETVGTWHQVWLLCTVGEWTPQFSAA